jgi:hypothetical protein
VAGQQHAREMIASYNHFRFVGLTVVGIADWLGENKTGRKMN